MRGNIYQHLPPREVDKLVRFAVGKNKARRPNSPVHKKLDYEDLCQTIHVRLANSVYEAKKASPSTFIFTCVETELGKAFRSLNSPSNGEFVTTTSDSIPNTAIAYNLEDFSWVDWRLPIDKRLLQVLVLRFAYDYTQREVAVLLDTSLNQVRKLEQSARKAAQHALAYQ